MRASSLVNCHFILASLLFQCVCHAFTSFFIVSMLSIRRLEIAPFIRSILFPLYLTSCHAWVYKWTQPYPIFVLLALAQKLHIMLTVYECSNYPLQALFLVHLYTSHPLYVWRTLPNPALFSALQPIHTIFYPLMILMPKIYWLLRIVRIQNPPSLHDRASFVLVAGFL